MLNVILIQEKSTNTAINFRSKIIKVKLKENEQLKQSYNGLSSKINFLFDKKSAIRNTRM